MKITADGDATLTLAGYKSPDGSLHPDGCGWHCFETKTEAGETPLWVLDGGENNAMKWRTASVPTVPGS